MFHRYVASITFVANLNGILINGDFVKPEGIAFNYENGRFEIKKHLKMLEELGYEKIACPFKCETSLKNSATANNYACIVAKKF